MISNNENENENELSVSKSIDGDKLTNSLSIDISRCEMSWNQNIENLLKNWNRVCKDKSKHHILASKKKKRIYYILQLPIITMPFILGFTSTLYENEHYLKYITSFGNTFLGIISGLNAFLNYSKGYIEHENASNRYEEISLEIESILTKKKKYRIPADVTIEKYQQKIESLNKFSITI
jgi:ubiquinone/menaquinone biosynthesis C-methylase UbiE